MPPKPLQMVLTKLGLNIYTSEPIGALAVQTRAASSRGKGLFGLRFQKGYMQSIMAEETWQ